MKPTSSFRVLALGAITHALADEFTPICGDCWCIIGETESSCPAFGPGHYEMFDDAVSEAYASFNLVATPGEELPKLASEDGGECFPFTHVGPVDKFPKSNLPQCESFPLAGADGAACAFKYPAALTDGDSCCGRDYQMRTYESESSAVEDGATVTHFGACGVCSTATDLAVMGRKVAKSGKTLDSATIICTVPYVTSVYTLQKEPNAEFDTLVDCYINEVGYSDECALLWAYSSATSSTLCLDECSGSPPYNGPPPECQLSTCLQCTESLQGEQFLAFAGRNNANSGITQPIARPCSDFSSVVHEPCDGLSPEEAASECAGGGDVPPSPTQPPSEAFATFSLSASVYILSSVGVFLVVLNI